MTTARRLSLYNNFTGERVLTQAFELGHLSLMGTGLNGRVWVEEHLVGNTTSIIHAISLTGEKEITFDPAPGDSSSENRHVHLYEFSDGTIPSNQKEVPIVYIQFNPTHAGRQEIWRGVNDVWVSTEEWLGRDHLEFAVNADRIAGRLYIAACWSGTAPHSTQPGVLAWIDPLTDVYTIIKTYDRDAIATALVGNDGFIYARSQSVNQANVLEKMTPDGTLVDSVVLTGLANNAYGGIPDRALQDAHGRLYWQVGTGLWRINYGTMDINATATLPDADFAILERDAFDGRGVLLTKVEAGAAPNNVVYVLMDSLTSDQVPLSVIVTDLCAQCGLTAADIDVTQLTSTMVSGYVIAQRGSVRSMLEPLMGTYFFGAVESDGKIKFVMRGGALAVTIPEDKLAAHTGGDTPDQLTITRKQEMDLPVQVDINYINPAIDYQVSTQVARRTITQSKKRVTLNVAIVLTDDQANRIAHTHLYDAWIERESYEFSTSVDFTKYEPTDIAAIVKNGVTHGGRFEGKDDGADGVIRWRAVADAAHIYAMTMTGAAAGSLPAAVRVMGPTEAALLDTPLLREVDDHYGFYEAARGFTTGWTGQDLHISRDSGVSYEITTNSRMLTPSTMGRTTSVLGTYPDDETNELFDEANSVTVYMDDGTLASATKAEVLNGANYLLIGNEVVQFRDAALIAAKTYTLSGFLRGRSSESFMSNHAVGERVVLLNNGIRDITQLPTDRDVDRMFKAVSLGSALVQTQALSFTNTMRRLKPLAPVHVRAGKTSNGDILIEWIRRSRYQSMMFDGAAAPLGENTELYRINVYDFDSTLLNSHTSAVPTFTYTVAQQTADFGGETYGPIFGIQQVSDKVGPGYEKRITPDMGGGAHAYWRFASITVGSNAFAPRDMKLLQGAVNVSLNGIGLDYATAVAAGVMFCTVNTFGGGPTTSGIAGWFDESFSTIAQVAKANIETAGAWIRFDFTSHTLGRVALTAINFKGSGAASNHPVALSVEWSDDDVVWTPKKVLTGLVWPGDNVYHTSDISLD